MLIMQVVILIYWISSIVHAHVVNSSGEPCAVMITLIFQVGEEVEKLICTTEVGKRGPGDGTHMWIHVLNLRWKPSFDGVNNSVLLVSVCYVEGSSLAMPQALTHVSLLIWSGSNSYFCKRETSWLIEVKELDLTRSKLGGTTVSFPDFQEASSVRGLPKGCLVNIMSEVAASYMNQRCL